MLLFVVVVAAAVVVVVFAAAVDKGWCCCYSCSCIYYLLNITLFQELQDELSSLTSDFEELRCLCQPIYEEVDHDSAKEVENKIQEIDSLLESASNELERLELELETVANWYVDYESSVNEWLAWFEEAKERLDDCRINTWDAENIDEKDNIIQVTLIFFSKLVIF